MIKADEKYWARTIFNFYIDKLLKKNFSHFYSVNEIDFPKTQESILVTPNHFSWWDGFFIDYILRNETNLKLKIMMLEEQLKQYWFFRYLGAFSINLNNKISIKNSMNYASKLLNQKGNCVTIYPQGKIDSFHKRPIELKEGIKLLLKDNPGTQVITVGFAIDFANEQKPFAAVRFGRTFLAEEILFDFDDYKKSFTSNLNSLSETISNRKFHKDYFDNDS